MRMAPVTSTGIHRFALPFPWGFLLIVVRFIAVLWRRHAPT